MKMRTVMGVAVGAASIIVTIGGVASAGEVAGNGKEITVRAKSDCAFSGLEDFDMEQPAQPGVVQNWGFVKRQAGLSGGANEQTIMIPGVGVITIGCNAHLYPIK